MEAAHNRRTLELVSWILDPNPGSGTPLTRSTSEHEHRCTTIPRRSTPRCEATPKDPTNLREIARGDAGEVEPGRRRGDGEQERERRGAPEHRRRPHRRGGGGSHRPGDRAPEICEARRWVGGGLAGTAWRARSGGWRRRRAARCEEEASGDRWIFPGFLSANRFYD